VRVIARRTLREFWITHADAMEPLKAWHAIVSRADWKGPADVKAVFGNASIVAHNRVVFNIKGNDYRLVARFAYGFGRCWVRFVGTHAEYDRIDAATV
jgi:mRNA interferase HigB